MAVLEMIINQEDYAGMKRVADYYGSTLEESCLQALNRYLVAERRYSTSNRAVITKDEREKLREMVFADRKTWDAECETEQTNIAILLDIGDKEFAELEEAADKRGMKLEDVCEYAINDYICRYLESVNPVLSGEV